MKFCLIGLILLTCTVLLGQEEHPLNRLEGRVVDFHTGKPVPFAKVYNKSLQKGAITNEEGYFSVPGNGLHDTLIISAIGFQRSEIVRNDRSYCEIQLEETVQLIEEMIVSPDANEYLYRLVERCRKRTKQKKTESKAYFELKTFNGDQQLELIQAYYNAGILGYDLLSTELKAGRIASQPIQKTNFVSLESSRAVAMMKLLKENPYYPEMPTALSLRKLRRTFYLQLEKRYAGPMQDTVSVIRFFPKDTTKCAFHGKLWVNEASEHFIKVMLEVKGADNHPFLPLFETDSILNVDLSVTRTFRETEDAVFLNHVDFQYTIDYKSRTGRKEELEYQVQTNAVLYAYSPEQLFELPHFRFPNEDIGDYRKISGLPYNGFFWGWNDEYKVKESAETNEYFFHSSHQSSGSGFQVGKDSLSLFEKPYIQWSDNRILFRDEWQSGTQKGPRRTEINAQKYFLDFQLFLDVNTYADSTNLLTRTICDPYESYYQLPLDNTAHCFINIYFDLMEIRRRELEKELRMGVERGADVHKIYDDFMVRLGYFQTDFLKKVQRGTNIRELRKWNNVVLNELRIDNMAIFGISEK